MPSRFNRDDLQKLSGMTPRLLRAFEDQAVQVSDNTTATTANVAATEGIGNATVLVLSPNDAFANERVLAVGFGLALQDGGPGNDLTLRLLYPIKTNGGFRCTFNLLADTNLTLPTTGTVATTIFPGPFTSDTNAANNGVAVGEAYRTSFTDSGGTAHNIVAWRQN